MPSVLHEARSSAAFPQPKKPSRIRPEVNVTPLVDVVLVLLIIFMVVAPEIEHGSRVEPPSVAHPDPDSQPGPQDITVTVARDGAIFLGDETVPRAELLPRLKHMHTKTHTFGKLRLKGDEQRPYGEMRDLFKDLQSAGYTSVKLLVSQRNVPRPAPEE